jgi:3-phenylpropionate/cinnamic acid dioxygenase small subunit
MIDSLRRAADNLEIRNLLNRLAHLADTGDLEEYVNCWTEDASWEIPEGVQRGHDAIRARELEPRQAGRIGPGSNKRHVLMNQIVRVPGGDIATSEEYMILMAQTATTPSIVAIHHHRDTFKRTLNGWKLARRQSSVV